MSSEFFNIDWHDTSPSGKTQIYQVTSKDRKVVLGEIKWWAFWRKYCFFPDRDCLFDPKCLRAMADSLEEMTKSRTKKGTGKKTDPVAIKTTK